MHLTLNDKKKCFSILNKLTNKKEHMYIKYYKIQYYM